MKTNWVVDDDIHNFVPDIFIEYLGKLISSDITIRAIQLVPSKVSPARIQDVYIRSETGTTMRRVFGFTPIDIRLHVFWKGENVILRLEQ